MLGLQIWIVSRSNSSHGCWLKREKRFSFLLPLDSRGRNSIPIWWRNTTLRFSCLLPECHLNCSFGQPELFLAADRILFSTTTYFISSVGLSWVFEIGVWTTGTIHADIPSHGYVRASMRFAHHRDNHDLTMKMRREGLAEWTTILRHWQFGQASLLSWAEEFSYRTQGWQR